MWKLRGKEEAAEFWDREFGHLRKDAGSPEGERPPPPRREQGGREFVATLKSRGMQSPVFAAAAAAAMSRPSPSPEEARMRPTVESASGAAGSGLQGL